MAVVDQEVPCGGPLTLASDSFDIWHSRKMDLSGLTRPTSSPLGYVVIMSEVISIQSRLGGLRGLDLCMVTGPDMTMSDL